MGTAICGRCGAWVNDQAWRCHQCGRLLPGLFGQRRWLDSIFSRTRSQARVLLVVLVVLYVFELFLSSVTPTGLDGRRPGISVDPTGVGMARAGALLQWEFTRHQPWRVVDAMLLHVNVLHIACNGMSLLTLGMFIEELFGPARFWVVFTLTGIVGNLSMLWLQAVSIGAGASGGLFGLMGAMLGWGIRRGGVFGAEIKRQTLRWLVYGAIISLIPGIGWSAHAGGAVSGFLLSYLLAIPDRRGGRESDGARFVALGCVALQLLSLVAMLLAAARWPHF
jgi:membrane associated rhomboid family serine protease